MVGRRASANAFALPVRAFAFIATRPSTILLLSTGGTLEVEGSPLDVGKPLQDAVRSSPGTLAWLTDANTGERVAVNPAHVVTLVPAPLS